MIQCVNKGCSEYPDCKIIFDCPFFKPDMSGIDIKEKKNKYHAEKCIVDGITFASRKEAQRYSELRLLERAGKITELKRQVSYELIPTQRDKDGKLIEKAVKYIADFVYKDKDGNLIAEDVKGCQKGGAYNIFVLKRKLMLYVYGIQVKEI